MFAVTIGKGNGLLHFTFSDYFIVGNFGGAKLWHSNLPKFYPSIAPSMLISPNAI